MASPNTQSLRARIKRYYGRILKNPDKKFKLSSNPTPLEQGVAFVRAANRRENLTRPRHKRLPTNPKKLRRILRQWDIAEVTPESITIPV